MEKWLRKLFDETDDLSSLTVRKVREIYRREKGRELTVPERACLKYSVHRLLSEKPDSQNKKTKSKTDEDATQRLGDLRREQNPNGNSEGWESMEGISELNQEVKDKEETEENGNETDEQGNNVEDEPQEKEQNPIEKREESESMEDISEHYQAGKDEEETDENGKETEEQDNNVNDEHQQVESNEDEEISEGGVLQNDDDKYSEGSKVLESAAGHSSQDTLQKTEDNKSEDKNDELDNEAVTSEVDESQQSVDDSESECKELQNQEDDQLEDEDKNNKANQRNESSKVQKCQQGIDHSVYTENDWSCDSREAMTDEEKKRKDDDKHKGHGMSKQDEPVKTPVEESEHETIREDHEIPEDDLNVREKEDKASADEVEESEQTSDASIVKGWLSHSTKIAKNLTYSKKTSVVVVSTKTAYQKLYSRTKSLGIKPCSVRIFDIVTDSESGTSAQLTRRGSDIKTLSEWRSKQKRKHNPSESDDLEASVSKQPCKFQRCEISLSSSDENEDVQIGPKSTALPVESNSSLVEKSTKSSFRRRGKKNYDSSDSESDSQKNKQRRRTNGKVKANLPNVQKTFQGKRKPVKRKARESDSEDSEIDYESLPKKKLKKAPAIRKMRFQKNTSKSPGEQSENSEESDFDVETFKSSSTKFKTRADVHIDADNSENEHQQKSRSKALKSVKSAKAERKYIDTTGSDSDSSIQQKLQSRSHDRKNHNSDSQESDASAAAKKKTPSQNSKSRKDNIKHHLSSDENDSAENLQHANKPTISGKKRSSNKNLTESTRQTPSVRLTGQNIHNLDSDSESEMEVKTVTSKKKQIRLTPRYGKQSSKAKRKDNSDESGSDSEAGKERNNLHKTDDKRSRKSKTNDNSDESGSDSDDSNQHKKGQKTAGLGKRSSEAKEKDSSDESGSDSEDSKQHKKGQKTAGLGKRSSKVTKKDSSDESGSDSEDSKQHKKGQKTAGLGKPSSKVTKKDNSDESGNDSEDSKQHKKGQKTAGLGKRSSEAKEKDSSDESGSDSEDSKQHKKGQKTAGLGKRSSKVTKKDSSDESGSDSEDSNQHKKGQKTAGLGKRSSEAKEKDSSDESGSDSEDSKQQKKGQKTAGLGKRSSKVTKKDSSDESGSDSEDSKQHKKGQKTAGLGKQSSKATKKDSSDESGSDSEDSKQHKKGQNTAGLSKQSSKVTKKDSSDESGSDSEDSKQHKKGQKTAGLGKRSSEVTKKDSSDESGSDSEDSKQHKKGQKTAGLSKQSSKATKKDSSDETGSDSEDSKQHQKGQKTAGLGKRSSKATKKDSSDESGSDSEDSKQHKKGQKTAGLGKRSSEVTKKDSSDESGSDSEDSKQHKKGQKTAGLSKQSSKATKKDSSDESGSDSEDSKQHKKGQKTAGLGKRSSKATKKDSSDESGSDSEDSKQHKKRQKTAGLGKRSSKATKEDSGDESGSDSEDHKQHKKGQKTAGLGKRSSKATKKDSSDESGSDSEDSKQHKKRQKTAGLGKRSSKATKEDSGDESGSDSEDHKQHKKGQKTAGLGKRSSMAEKKDTSDESGSDSEDNKQHKKGHKPAGQSHKDGSDSSEDDVPTSKVVSKKRVKKVKTKSRPSKQKENATTGSTKQSFKKVNETTPIWFHHDRGTECDNNTSKCDRFDEIWLGNSDWDVGNRVWKSYKGKAKEEDEDQQKEGQDNQMDCCELVMSETSDGSDIQLDYKSKSTEVNKSTLLHTDQLGSGITAETKANSSQSLLMKFGIQQCYVSVFDIRDNDKLGIVSDGSAPTVSSETLRRAMPKTSDPNSDIKHGVAPICDRKHLDLRKSTRATCASKSKKKRIGGSRLNSEAKELLSHNSDKMEECLTTDEVVQNMEDPHSRPLSEVLPLTQLSSSGNMEDDNNFDDSDTLGQMQENHKSKLGLEHTDGTKIATLHLLGTCVNGSDSDELLNSKGKLGQSFSRKQPTIRRQSQKTCKVKQTSEAGDRDASSNLDLNSKRCSIQLKKSLGKGKRLKLQENVTEKCSQNQRNHNRSNTRLSNVGSKIRGRGSQDESEGETHFESNEQNDGTDQVIDINEIPRECCKLIQDKDKETSLKCIDAKSDNEELGLQSWDEFTDLDQYVSPNKASKGKLLHGYDIQPCHVCIFDVLKQRSPLLTGFNKLLSIRTSESSQLKRDSRQSRNSNSDEKESSTITPKKALFSNLTSDDSSSSDKFEILPLYRSAKQDDRNSDSDLEATLSKVKFRMQEQDNNSESEECDLELDTPLHVITPSKFAIEDMEEKKSAGAKTSSDGDDCGRKSLVGVVGDRKQNSASVKGVDSDSETDKGAVSKGPRAKWKPRKSLSRKTRKKQTKSCEIEDTSDEELVKRSGRKDVLMDSHKDSNDLPSATSMARTNVRSSSKPGQKRNSKLKLNSENKESHIEFSDENANEIVMESGPVPEDSKQISIPPKRTRSTGENSNSKHQRNSKNMDTDVTKKSSRCLTERRRMSRKNGENNSEDENPREDRSRKKLRKGKSTPQNEHDQLDGESGDSNLANSEDENLVVITDSYSTSASEQRQCKQHIATDDEHLQLFLIHPCFVQLTDVMKQAKGNNQSLSEYRKVPDSFVRRSPAPNRNRLSKALEIEGSEETDESHADMENRLSRGSVKKTRRINQSNVSLPRATSSQKKMLHSDSSADGSEDDWSKVSLKKTPSKAKSKSRNRHPESSDTSGSEQNNTAVRNSKPANRNSRFTTKRVKAGGEAEQTKAVWTSSDSSSESDEPKALQSRKRTSEEPSLWNKTIKSSGSFKSKGDKSVQCKKTKGAEKSESGSKAPNQHKKMGSYDESGSESEELMVEENMKAMSSGSAGCKLKELQLKQKKTAWSSGETDSESDEPEQSKDTRTSRLSSSESEPRVGRLEEGSTSADTVFRTVIRKGAETVRCLKASSSGTVEKSKNATSSEESDFEPVDPKASESDTKRSGENRGVKHDFEKSDHSGTGCGKTFSLSQAAKDSLLAQPPLLLQLDSATEIDMDTEQTEDKSAEKENDDADSDPGGHHEDEGWKKNSAEKISCSVGEEIDYDLGNDNGDSDDSSNSRDGVSQGKKNTDKHGRRYARLIEICRIAGVGYLFRIRNSQSCQERCEILEDLLEENGMQGEPTLKKAKRLRLKKEAAELDTENILSSQTGRTRGSVPKSGTPAKKKFSRLQDIIDTEGSSA